MRECKNHSVHKLHHNNNWLADSTDSMTNRKLILEFNTILVFISYLSSSGVLCSNSMNSTTMTLIPELPMALLLYKLNSYGNMNIYFHDRDN